MYRWRLWCCTVKSVHKAIFGCFMFFCRVLLVCLPEVSSKGFLRDTIIPMFIYQHNKPNSLFWSPFALPANTLWWSRNHDSGTCWASVHCVHKLNLFSDSLQVSCHSAWWFIGAWRHTSVSKHFFGFLPPLLSSKLVSLKWPKLKHVRDKVFC